MIPKFASSLVLLTIGIAAISLSSGVLAQETDPATLLQNAVITTNAEPSFHFSIKNEEGKTRLYSQLELGTINGEMQRPDRFKATVHVNALRIPASVKIVGIGPDFWATDPIPGRRDFSHYDVDPELMALLTPDRFVALVPALLQNPTLDGPDPVDDQPATRISGMVDLRNLPTVAPGIDTDPFVLDGPIPAQIWIDEAGRIIKIRLEGRLIDRDSDDLVREISLSDFGLEVDIQPPD